VLVHRLDLLSLHQRLVEASILLLVYVQPLASVLNKLLKFNKLMLISLQLHFLPGLSEGCDKLTGGLAHASQINIDSTTTFSRFQRLMVGLWGLF